MNYTVYPILSVILTEIPYRFKAFSSIQTRLKYCLNSCNISCK